MAELLVYALASTASTPLRLRGISNERLETVRIGGLDAIVGRVRTVPKPTDRTLRRYTQTMAALWHERPALLPARFGTVARDQSDLVSMIGDREQSMRRRLRAVRHRAQMTVRMVIASGSPVPDPQPPVPDPRSPARGRLYLEARQQAQHMPAFLPLRYAVRRWIRDERQESRGKVASVYHLIPRGAADRYRSVLEQAARDAGVRLTVSGPWPPYAFGESW